MWHARGFCFSTKSPLPTAARRLTSVTFNGKGMVRYDYDDYGDLTSVYGCDGKKLRGFAYRNHIMVEHNQPDGLVSRYEYDRYDTDGKVLKSSNNLGEAWTFDYRKDHTVITDALGRTEVYGFDENRELVCRIDADGQRSDSERDDYGHITVERAPPRTRKPPVNPLLPLRSNRHSKRNDR